MKNYFKTAAVYGAALLMCMAISTNGYSQKKKKTPKGAYKLEYNFPVNKPLSFSDASILKMTIDVSGSTMETSTISLNASTFTAAGKSAGNLNLNVRIDTISQVMESPMGSLGGVMSEVAGKTFAMTLSPAGKAVDVSEAEKIKVTFEGTESDLAQAYIEFFPKLPEKPVKPGDTWISNDTIGDKAGNSKMIVESTSKFEGIVKMDGTDCARITSTFKGKREIKTSAGGMDIFISGDIAGTEELCFAVKEGYPVKQTSDAKMSGNLDISGAQSMTMPMVADITSSKKLKK